MTDEFSREDAIFSREDAKPRSKAHTNCSMSLRPILTMFPFASSRLRVNQNNGGSDERG
jgi:hypothetical protein